MWYNKEVQQTNKSGGINLGAKIRRTQDNLFVLGTSVIVFGLWNLIKFVIYFFAAFNDIKGTVGEEYFLITVIMSWAIFVFSFVLRCFIGFSARAEGKGKRKNVVYLVFAGMIALVYFCVIAVEGAYLILRHNHIFSMIITLIIDITSFVFLVELIVNSIKIRKLRKGVSE